MDNFLKILSSYLYKVFFVLNLWKIFMFQISFLETVFDIVELQKKL